tara:strand:+ start:138 stop:389 length:252 start_codon:yes stop_codon:yes gene_type:complete
MQITSKGDTIVLDYYPIKSWSNNIIPDKYLRILTFKGQTQTKRIVSTQQLDEEVRDRVDNFTYRITGNKDNLPQFHSQTGGAL